MTRLLLIDFTRVGGETATGQLKRNFLIGWPDGAFLQIATQGDRYIVARSLDDASTDAFLSEEEVLDQVASFQPEVIYYRPTIDLHPHLHALALNVLARNPAPLVTHIMDDWPSRLEADDPARGRSVDQDLRRLLSQSDKVLSISDKMSAVLGDRYGVTFEPIANGVDPDAYRTASAASKPKKSGREEVVLRYCGGLAEDMTFQTVLDVARAVDALRAELPMRLDVYTMPYWRRPFEEATANLGGITISDGVFGNSFPSLLAEADVLLLAYNFDENSLRYIGLSMPNKLPEYLASGVPVLAVGPREANGIEYVLSRGLGCCVTDRDPERLAAALRRLGTDSDYRNELTAKAQAWAAEHLDLAQISMRFQTILRETAAGPVKRPLEHSHRSAVAPAVGASAGAGSEVGDNADPVMPAGLSRYERIHLWATTRNPAILFVGRVVMWCGRKVRRYPVLTAIYLAMLAGLVTAGVLSGGAAYGPLLWTAAGILAAMGALVVVMGFNRFLTNEARHELELQHLSLRRRVEGSETTLRDQKAQMDALRAGRESEASALETKIAELLSAQQQSREALLAEIGGLRSDKEAIATLAAEMARLKSETAAISERALSLDIVSALRQLHPLWEGRNGVRRSDFAEETEHGHAVMMALLVEEQRKTPGALRGKTLIEVGSTRERDPRQGSTEKLAIFTGMMDMRFVTVDVDPINTQRARRVIDLLNPGAEAITERGEDYLATGADSLDYVYLDAFDFDHDQHSAERRARYREVLNTEIQDPACWQMHQLCAAAIITKMPEGGIVVIDDTWTDDAGDFDGKGKLAVPLLLASGFTVMAQAPTAVALRR